MKTLLLTWWAWYIGSHNAVILLQEWYDIIIFDNLSNSSESVVEKIKEIAASASLNQGGIVVGGDTPPQSPSVEGEANPSEQGEVSFYKWDLRNISDLEAVFSENSIDAVIHFAWLKAVGESCEMPHEYYENNIVGTMNLAKVMEQYGCKDIIFSSSATVYNPNQKPPFSELTLTWETTNPYGTSKFIIENILRDLANHKDFRVVNLRYFNPVGAHSSGLIGEDPSDIPNNLLPYIMKVASGELKSLSVYGNDYDTIDGTWVRDYIHVEDLAAGHLASLEWLQNKASLNEGGEKTPPQSPSVEGEGSASDQGELFAWIFEVFNLGTWNGTSVLEMITLTQEIIWKTLPYSIVSRRPWDIASAYCSPKKAEDLLKWKAHKSVKDAIADSWKFITMQTWK